MSWQLSSLLVLGLVLVAGFGWYERERPSARVLSLVAALAALAVVGRLAFAAIPNVKPTTDIVLFAGYALGAVPGFAVGAVTALVSNMFLSQGPWTAWQMVGWGAVGIGGALLARLVRGRELGRWPMAAVCGLAGLGFGAWMDVYQWTLAARQDLDSYLAVSVSSLPYNLAHAIGNVVFCLLIGPVFVRALRRYRRRFEVRWEAPAPGAAAAAGVVLVLAVVAGGSFGSAAPAAAQTAAAAKSSSASARAVRYLRAAQNSDGGFGAARGQSSSQLMTGWSALGLASARRNPRDVHRRRGKRITTYLRRNLGSLHDIGEVERTILVLRAAGLSARSFGGRDLVAELLSRRRSDGSVSGYVSYTAFGILALRAARTRVGKPTVRWLVKSQNSDGGFGVARSSGSDADMTGAGLQALAVTGHGSGAAAKRAVSYLRGNRNDDGGFGQMKGRSSNAQSTAYAVQGLLAVRAGSDLVSSGLRYLKRLQRGDGSIRYSNTSAQTPVWVTAQALTALRRKPLPIATVPRTRRRAASASAATAGPKRKSKRRAARAAAEAQVHTSARIRVRDRDVVGSRPTSAVAPANDSNQGGPAAWLLAVAGAVTLVLLWLLRRYLRRRRPAVS